MGGSIVVDMRLAVVLHEPGRVWVDGHADDVGVVGLHDGQIGVQGLILDAIGRGKGDQVGLVADGSRHAIGEVRLQADARVGHDARGIRLVGLGIHLNILRVLYWFLFLPGRLRSRLVS